MCVQCNYVFVDNSAAMVLFLSLDVYNLCTLLCEALVVEILYIQTKLPLHSCLIMFSLLNKAFQNSDVIVCGMVSSN